MKRYLQNKLNERLSISKIFFGLILTALTSSMLAHPYSAFGQFSATPAGPATTTPPLSQNTSSSSPVDEDVIINSLVFQPEGTGWLKLNNAGSISPLIPFTHNFTETNGYTIYSSVPFFTNNGSIVDLNSIDFSSQIIVDPSANMTLPARPVLSPTATPDVSSLPPPSSQIEASPSITTPPSPPTSPAPQSQQSAQTAPPITATPPTTPSTTTQTQDPDFTQFVEIAGQCANSAAFGSSGATMSQEQCTQFLEQGQEKWCGLAAYDAQKCDQATKLTAAWNNMVNLSERYGFSDIPSLGELGIDPRTIAPEGLLAPTP